MAVQGAFNNQLLETAVNKSVGAAVCQGHLHAELSAVVMPSSASDWDFAHVEAR